MNKIQNFIGWACFAYYTFIICCALTTLFSCSTQKEVVSCASLSMERQDSTIITTTHRENVEQFQNLKIEVLDSLDLVMIVTEFYPQIDTVTGFQLVKSFKDIRMNRGRKTETQAADSVKTLCSDSTVIQSGSKSSGKKKSKEQTRKQTKAGPDWEKIIVAVILVGSWIFTGYLIWTTPPVPPGDEENDSWP